MRTLIILFLSLFILFSCSNSVDTLNIKELENRGGVYFDTEKKQPYSGVVFENSTSGSKSMEGELDHGLQTGKWTQYYDNGQKKVGRKLCFQFERW